MRFTATFVTLVVLITSALAAPATVLHDVERHEDASPGRFIVTFQPGFDKTTFVPESGVTHNWDGEINGFAGHFDDATIEELRTNPHVQSIAEDGTMHAFATVSQFNATWGLSRLSSAYRLRNQNPSTRDFVYTFDNSAGAGVDIYVVDTGVLVSHQEFGGRARWGATFGKYPNADGNGHGTHAAGIAAGGTTGVAKAANVIAVKVLGDDGKGFNSDIISGFNWALNQARASGRPSIVSASLGGGASAPVDNAVAALTSAGVHVIVAAGNDNVDAGNTSPARAPSAITVGATTIADARASFSNYGRVVDIFAPGQDIISAWIGGNGQYKSISGTSMATPYISGLVAYTIRLQGNTPPDSMSNYLQSTAAKGVISGIPAGTVNLLANNGFRA